jgi:hypothetical protein
LALQNLAGTSLAALLSSSLVPSDDDAPAVLHGQGSATAFSGRPGEEEGMVRLLEGPGTE